MANALWGTVHGNSIELDKALPLVEGQRVRLSIEPLGEPTLSAAEQRRLWDEWRERGPQGPIEEDDVDQP